MFPDPLASIEDEPKRSLKGALEESVGRIKADAFPSHIRTKIARLTFEGWGWEDVLAKCIRDGTLSKDDRLGVMAEAKRYWR